MPAVLNRMLPARGGVTHRRWKRQPAAAFGATLDPRNRPMGPYRKLVGSGFD